MSKAVCINITIAESPGREAGEGKPALSCLLPAAAREHSYIHTEVPCVVMMERDRIPGDEQVCALIAAPRPHLCVHACKR